MTISASVVTAAWQKFVPGDLLRTMSAGRYWRRVICAGRRKPGVPDLDSPSLDSPSLDSLSLDEIRTRLHAQADTTYDVPPELLSDDAREAAVLVPLLRIDNAWHLLYIRRTSFEGDRHSGQVAFAGGKRDDIDDSLLATALREAEEEVGLAPADVEVLGYINHHHTISEFQVRPYVATIPWPYNLNPDGVEVARIFSIPLQWLADDANYRTEHQP